MRTPCRFLPLLTLLLATLSFAGCKGGTHAGISGQVVDRAGEPVAYAELKFTPVRGVRIGQRAPSFTITSDEAGRFIVRDLEPGSVALLHASGGGFLPRRFGPVRAPRVAETDTLLKLVLDKSLEISGTVVDENGRPQKASTRLTIQPYKLPGNELDWTGDGHFRFVGGPGHAEITAWTNEARAEPLAFEIVESQPITDLTLVLRPAAVVEGRVTSTSGKLVAGAHVEVQAPLGYFLSYFELPRASTDSEGRYRLHEVVRPGRWQIVVRQKASVSTAREVELVPGMNVVDFHLTSGREPSFTAGRRFPVRTILSKLDFFRRGNLTLSGEVWIDGEPVRGADIHLAGPSSGSADIVDDGQFEVTRLKAGTYQLRINAWSVEPNPARPREIIKLESDRRIRIDLVTGRIAGRVVAAATGEPIAGAQVQLASLADPAEGGRFLGGGPVHTDLQGRFAFDRILTGKYRVTARRSGQAPALATVDLRPGSASEIELALPPAVDLALDVRLPSGDPPTMIDVAILDAADQPLTVGKLAPATDGRFHLREIGAGSWRLQVTAAGTATVDFPVTVPGEPVVVELPPAARLQLEVPALTSGHHASSATFFDPQGRPGAAITWTGGFQTAFPLERGRLLVGGVPAGTWRVEVTAADGRTWTGTATTVAGETTELVLE